MIYLDNNATTTMPKCVMSAMLKWCNMGNPSASYATANDSRAMMDKFRNYIGTLCEITTCCPEDRDATKNSESSTHRNKYRPDEYKVIFTSGASEANSTIVSGVAAAYLHTRNVIPNIVISAVEHKGLISTARALEERGVATVTLVQPVVTGHILARDVARAIIPTTCLVCVMHANNETGAINDIAAIGAVAHSRGVPFHCDTVQTFGKFPLRPLLDEVDSFCVSFHKFRGPPGTGVLVVKQQFLQGYAIPPLVYGSQNEGYRGGTENLPGIGASYEALRYNFQDREEKNTKISALKTLLLKCLSAHYPVRSYSDYYGRYDSKTHTLQTHHSSKNIEIVVFSIPLLSGLNGQSGQSILNDEDYTFARDESYLCNTILLSVVKKYGEMICNSKLKKYLESNGIIVSVGSACNTASPLASHVLTAMSADKYVRAGTLRLSLGDDNTEDEVRKAVQVLVEAIKIQV